MSYILGIDFGTFFTVAAVLGPGDSSPRVVTLGRRSGVVPSALFVRPDGSLLFGDDAYLRAAGEPERLVHNLKRSVGSTATVTVAGASHEVEHLVATSLRWVLDRVVSQEGAPPRRTVVCHPANWRSTCRQAFESAIAAAGFVDVDLVTEPHAAAAFYAADAAFAPGSLVAVYDLGGGTFDAAVLRAVANPGGGVARFELVGEPEGVEHLGGVDFDDALMLLVQNKLGSQWAEAERSGGTGFALARAGLQRECIAAKEALSTEEMVEVPIVLPGLQKSVQIQRREFEALILPSLADTMGALHRALRGAGITGSQLTAVLLVGGSSGMPAVRELLGRTVGATVPLLATDPKHAVARGATLLATMPGPPPAPVVAAPVVAAPVVAAPAGAAPAAGIPAPAGPAPTGKSRKRLLIGAVATLAVAASAVGYGVTRLTSDQGQALIGRGSDRAGEVTTSAQAAAPTTTAVPRAASPEGMVTVPAGTYRLGSDTPGPEAAAARTETLAAFQVDAFEVSNRQYDRFVQGEGAPAPRSWPRGAVPQDKLDHPVTGVDWAWAQSYCVALSKRLPTDAEWEAAARGPTGSIFPWGSDAAAVDLETTGLRPVGALTANVSSLGVHDTVGSAWEWVGQSYEPIGPTQKVRRGGQYGRVRQGAAMRQVVEDSNESVVTETGFRCAAERVDPSVKAGQFLADHPIPEPTQATTTTVRAAGPGGLLVDDRFEDPRSGWAERTEGQWKVGYHAPTWYHLEASQPRVQVLSLGGFNYSDVAVETTVHLDKLDSPTGRFRYGLILRASGPIRPPAVGAGPPRPENFYAFVLDPRGGRWDLLHEDTLPLRSVATGIIPVVRLTDPNVPDVLRAEMRGNKLRLIINGTEVTVYDTRGYHLDGDLGFYVETLDETKVHVHFGGMKIANL